MKTSPVDDPAASPQATHNLKGKRVLVTGGTSGIGRSIATYALRAGADVASCALTDEGAGELAELAKAQSRQFFFRSVDLSDLSAARGFVREAVAALGGLDGLVNNAGTNFNGGVLDASEAIVDRCLRTNFLAAWAICQEAYPALRLSRAARVVNMSSIEAVRTAPGSFPYNASKAALNALTASLAVEWAADDILVVGVAPGWVDTPLNARGFARTGNEAQERQRIEQGHLLGRMARPEDVASLVTYLLTAENRFLTGVTILVDGGMSCVLTPN